MTISRTAAIKNVQAMLGLPELDGTRPVHEDCLLVSCDVEDFSRNRGQPLLEIGVAILDTRTVLELDPTVDGDFAYLAKIEVRHFRFQESCHIPNTAPWLSSDYNQPDKFMFGSTEFIWREQLQDAFTKMLRRPDDKTGGTIRQVHFVTHGGDHDRAHIGAFAEPPFDFDTLLPGSTKEELQFTSTAASQTIRDACNGQRPALWKVVVGSGLECLHLHNAGNDAMAQLSSLIMLALLEWRQRYAEQNVYNQDEDGEDRPEDEPMLAEQYIEEEYTGQEEQEAYLAEHEYDDREQEEAEQAADANDNYTGGDNKNDQPDQEDADSEQGLLSQVSDRLRAVPPAPLVGTNHHCTRCDSDEHDRKDCKTRMFIECQRCFRRGHHVTKHCYIRNDEYLEKKRRENWEHNWHRDIKNGYEPKRYVKLEDSELSSWDNIFETDTPRCNRRAEAEAAAKARAAAAAAAAAATTVEHPTPPAPPQRTWAQIARAAAQVPAAPVTSTAVVVTTSTGWQATTAARPPPSAHRTHPAPAQQQNGDRHVEDGPEVRIGSSMASGRGGSRGGRGGLGGGVDRGGKW